MDIFLYDLYIFFLDTTLRSFENGPQKSSIQTKMYIFYRKMTIYGHFSI